MLFVASFCSTKSPDWHTCFWLRIISSHLKLNSLCLHARQPCTIFRILYAQQLFAAHCHVPFRLFFARHISDFDVVKSHLLQFVIFNPWKVPWNWTVFYQNSFVISPCCYITWLDVILDDLQTRPFRQILLFLRNNS